MEMKKVLILGMELMILAAGLSGCIRETEMQEAAGNEQNSEWQEPCHSQNVPRWFCGDLHAHSTNSDGDIDVDSVIEIAENKGLDFFVLTEHNNNKTWMDPGYTSSKLTLLYGFEWTTDLGHANIWSDKPFNWSAIMAATNNGDASAARNAINAMRSIASENGNTILFSINHPYAPGCEWLYSFEDSREADCMEVWNAGYVWPNLNFMTLSYMLDSYLKQGKKISMVGGSDSHIHGADPSKPENWAQTLYHDIGVPTTWVYANSSRGADILEGIKAGHVFISNSPNGPKLQLWADAVPAKEGEPAVYETMMGDSLPAESIGKEVNFRVRVLDAKMTEFADLLSYVTVIKNGQTLTQTVGFSEDYCFDFVDIPASGDYYRVELRQIPLADTTNLFGEITQVGWLVAITNPIYAW